MSHRLERVNSLIREELSEMLRRDVKDPRLGTFVTVTAVNVTPDLKSAVVYVSYFGSNEEKQGSLKALASAAGFFHHELVKRLDMRHVPDLHFQWDDSIERGDRLLRLMDEVSSKEDQS